MPNSSHNKLPMPSEQGANNATVVSEAIQSIDDLIDGAYEFDVTSGDVTIDDTENFTNQARNAIWKIKGSPSASRKLIAPKRPWRRNIINNTTGGETIKVSFPSGPEELEIPYLANIRVVSDGYVITRESVGSVSWDEISGTQPDPKVHSASHEKSGSDELSLDASQISSGTLAKERLSTSGVTPGLYSSADINVDEYGRVTGASDGTGGGGGGGGYLGTWNADTNTPTIVSSTGTSGQYYDITVAGSTTIDGESSWSVGDQIKFGNGTWQKIPSSTTDATPSTKGVLRLNGDIGGTASSPRVVGITDSNSDNYTVGVLNSGEPLVVDGSTVKSVTLLPVKITSMSSGSTLTPTTSKDMFTVTSLAVAMTVNAPTGTPSDGQGLMLRLKGSGSPRDVTWNSVYREGGGASLPDKVQPGETTYVYFRYNSTDSKWDLLAVNGGF